MEELQGVPPQVAAHEEPSTPKKRKRGYLHILQELEQEMFGENQLNANGGNIRPMLRLERLEKELLGEPKTTGGLYPRLQYLEDEWKGRSEG